MKTCIHAFPIICAGLRPHVWNPRMLPPQEEMQPEEVSLKPSRDFFRLHCLFNLDALVVIGIEGHGFQNFKSWKRQWLLPRDSGLDWSL